MAGLCFGGAKPGVQGLFFQKNNEPPSASLNYSLPVHADGDSFVHIIWCPKKFDPKRQHGGRILCRLEQAWYDVVLIDAKNVGLFVPLEGVGAEHSFHARAALAPKFQIG